MNKEALGSISGSNSGTISGPGSNVPLDVAALDFMNFIDNYNTPEETAMSGTVILTYENRLRM